MPRNVYFSQGTTGEQNLYEDITIEGLKIYGHDAYYIPRKIVNEDSLFNEDQLSSFGSSYMIEAYVANVDGYEGEGDLLSKFGLEIKDQVTLVILLLVDLLLYLDTIVLVQVENQFQMVILEYIIQHTIPLE